MKSPRSSFQPSKFLRSGPGIVTVAALLLILFLFRPGVGELRNRIAGSIGNALGRRVELDNVRLRFFPRPGFDLEGLIIYDDPLFSAEPMIRAQEVSAAIRVRSLLRGRLEIATLSATEPSINLVRSNEGRWNLAGLAERNAQIPAAPTAKPPSERRPAFPYLEASGARINFKIGQTKKSYALVNADVALWQDSENSWGARIKAEPVRTDFNLTDTGLLQVNATWQRASIARSTPLQMAVHWQRGQLGQITQLLSGKDRGWRGNVDLSANLSGTPEALRIESQMAIRDFHRYDIVGSGNVQLTTDCSGHYDWVTVSFADLKCESPVGGGLVRLQGNASASPQAPAYDLTLNVEKVPLASVVRLLRQTKKQIPGDLVATGFLNAEFHATQSVPEARLRTANGSTEPPRSPKWTGSGFATNVRLSSNAEKDEFTFGTIPLNFVPPIAESRLGRSRLISQPMRGGAGDKEKEQETGEEPAEGFLRIGPVSFAMNGGAPVSASGWISRPGYRFSLRGDMELKDLFRLENALGLELPHPAVEGAAKLDLSVSGPWQGFATPTVLGNAQLHNVRAEIRGLNTPIEISSASVIVAPDVLSLQKISAHTGTTHWTGTVAVPRNCGAQGGVPNCAYQFDLAADELSTSDLVEWFAPHSAKRPWYRIVNSAAPANSPLLALQAHGKMRVGRFAIRRMVATQVVTKMDIDRGNIDLTALHAQILQGTHQGNWTIALRNHELSNVGGQILNPTNGEPAARENSDRGLQYHGSGTLQNISLAQIGALMNDPWVTGTADGSFDLTTSGQDFREALARCEGKLQFKMRDGSLPNLQLQGTTGPLPVHRFSGELNLKNGAWELSSGKLESHKIIYQVKGIASSEKGLNFVLTRSDEQFWNVTGTLAKPHVAPAEQTEATNMKAAKP